MYNFVGYYRYFLLSMIYGPTRFASLVLLHLNIKPCSTCRALPKPKMMNAGLGPEYRITAPLCSKKVMVCLLYAKK